MVVMTKRGSRRTIPICSSELITTTTSWVVTDMFVSKILCTTSRVSFDGQPERSTKSESSSRDEYNSKSHLMVGDTGRVKGTKRCPKKAG